jgi:hypothetical protein
LGRIERSNSLLPAAVEAAAADAATPAEVLVNRAQAAHSAGEIDRCLELLHAALARPAPALTEATALIQLIMGLVGQGVDTTEAVRRLTALADGRGPVFRLFDLVGRGIGGLLTDPVQARIDLEEARDLADSLGTVILAAQSRTALPMTAIMAGAPLEALRLERDAVAWTADRGAWSMSTAALGTLALLLEGEGDVGTAVTLISARQTNGYATAFNLEAINAAAARAETAHPDHYGAWWEAGTRLDLREAAELGVAAADAVLAPSTEEAPTPQAQGDR